MWALVSRIRFLLILVSSAEALDFGLILNRESFGWNYWPTEFITSNIEIRLVKRTWFPARPPSNTQTIPSQAPYSVQQAFGIMRNGPLYEFEKQPLQTAENLFLSRGYEPSKESIVIIPTLSEGADDNGIRTTVIALALRNMHVNYNVFIVNMPGLDHLMIATIQRVIFGIHNQFLAVGSAIAGFLKKGIDMYKLKPGQIHLIGFCFSGQLAGYIGRVLPGKIKSIMALDPFSFGLSQFSMVPLSKYDAKTVHALHTSSVLQGTFRRTATADFVFNTGSFQPGCLFNKDLFCSHSRAMHFFWYSMLFSDMFAARRCSNYLAFRTCGCEDKPTTHITYPPNPSAKGKYFIRTAAHYPYGLYDIGATCKPFKTPRSEYDKKP